MAPSSQKSSSPPWPLLAATLFALCLAGCSVDRNDQQVSASSTSMGETDSASSTTSALPRSTTTAAPYAGPIHVSPDGDDLADGSPDDPLRSIDDAVERAKQGGSVIVAQGSYAPFEITDARDLSVRAAEGATVSIRVDGYPITPGVLVQNSTGVSVTGLTIDGPLWGVMVESSSDITIESNLITNLGQEGIMVRHNSSDVNLIGNHISLTGQKPGANAGRPYSNFGEGIYLGSPRPLDDGSNDLTERVRIADNTIVDVSAEAIDVKPWVDQVVIEGNYISRVNTATSGAIVVGIGDVVTDASDVVIRDNVIHDVRRTSRFLDGNAVVISAPAIVSGNVIWGTQHYGILIDENLRAREGGDVVVVRNVIFDSGEAAIHSRADSTVPVRVGNNTTGEEARERLGDPTRESAFALIADLASDRGAESPVRFE